MENKDCDNCGEEVFFDEDLCDACEEEQWQEDEFSDASDDALSKAASIRRALLNKTDFYREAYLEILGEALEDMD